MNLLDFYKAKQLDEAQQKIQYLNGNGTLTKWEPDYSYGLAALANKSEIAANGHGSDAGKLPNHPTFSNEAVLSQKGMEGGDWSNVGGSYTYTPSLDQVLGRSGMSVSGLANYMKNREKGVELGSPIPIDPEYFKKVTK